MYLVDASILIRPEAHRWLLGALDGPTRTVGLPWPSTLAYLRGEADPVGAWEAVEDWIRRPAAWIPTPGQRHMAHLERLLRSVYPTGSLMDDAHLAALASEHALTIVSADGDFAKFEGVKWMNPLGGA